jgi:hypothetical protein
MLRLASLLPVVLTGLGVLAFLSSSSSANASDEPVFLPLAASDGGAPPVPACIQVSSEARYVPFGYNHIVTLRSGCSRAATCTVSTDVNPKPITADVPSNQTVEVVTFAVSPSQNFTASVNCVLH